MRRLNRDIIRDIIAKTFFEDARDTLKLFEEDIARIYKIIEETPVNNDTQHFMLLEAVTDREYNVLCEIIEEAADKICDYLDDEKDTGW